jgi:starch-binding outer membrane protein, SusD/RagB family
MKRRTRAILLTPLFLAAAACSDEFTLLSPISERNVENFYRTETDFTVAINGAYATLASPGAYNRAYVLLHEMRSDNMMNGGGSTGLAQNFHRIAHFQEVATQAELSTAWTTAYQGIARTNLILDRLGNLSNQALANRIRGEALFIRSLFYYNLAVLWGNVPLQLESVTTPDVRVNQVNATAVYDQIIRDLETAQGLLPVTYTGANVGRATQGAANTLLGLVYLTKGERAQAATALRRVVSSGRYQLVPNYANLWGPTVKNTAESVFELQYRAGGTGTGSQYTDHYTPFGGTGGVGAGQTPQVIAPGLPETFDVQHGIPEQDRRRPVTVATHTDGTLFVRKWQSQPFGPGDADNNVPVFRYADVLLMLAEALGESPESYALINQVRQRAGVTPIGPQTPGTFAEKLLFERKLEFVSENKRWADLLRFGVARRVMGSFLQGTGVTEASVRLVYPIPQRELDVAPGQMVQNSF